MDHDSSSPQLRIGYIGYNTIGGSNESIAASAWQAYAKRVTPASDCVLLGIGAYIAGNATNVSSFWPCVFSDNAGVPGIAIAGFGAETTTGVLVPTMALNSTARWFTVPITCLLTGGTPVWLGFNTGNGLTLAYDAGSDYRATTGTTWAPEDPVTYWSFSNQSRSYSIRGLVMAS